MELADAGDLLQRINVHKRQGTMFQESDLWRMFGEVAKGLKALHDLQIMHRDLKVMR
jgi:NIMA (never in mitosis gene a)-related kinase